MQWQCLMWVMVQMYEQMDIFSLLPVQFKPGDWIEEKYVGKELTFDEITKRIGNLIVMDYSTESHRGYKVVMVEKITIVEGSQRRLIFYDGCRQRGLVNEIYFSKESKSRSRAYEIKMY